MDLTFPQLSAAPTGGTRIASAIASILLALATLPAHAGTPDPKAVNLRPAYGACVDKSGGQMEAMTACMDAEFAYQDKRLNRVYKRVMATLAEPAKTQLRTEERQWITQKDSSCNSGTDPGQFDEINAYDCKIIATADRAAALEKRTTANKP